jgi:hypothetical protein
VARAAQTTPKGIIAPATTAMVPGNRRRQVPRAPAGPAGRQERVQRREHEEGRAALLDDEREAREDACGKERDRPTRLDRAEQDERTAHCGEQDEVLGVRRETLKSGAQRQDGEDGCRCDSGRSIEEAGRDEEDEDARRGIDDQESQMDPRDRLPEGGKDGGVDRVHSRELGVIRGRVRWNPVEQELPEVRILALVPVEGSLEQPEPHRRRHQEDEAQDKAGPDVRSPTHRGRRGGRPRCRIARQRCPPGRSSRSRARNPDGRWTVPWPRSARPAGSSCPGD